MLHSSDNILLIRKMSGQTQAEFSSRFTKVTLGMQKSYEGGKTPPSHLYIQELADIAGLTIDDVQMKKLTKDDIVLGGKVNKVNSAHFTAEQLFAMFMEVSKAQTAILAGIKEDMARKDTQAIMNSNLIRVLTGVQVLSGDHEKILKQLQDLLSAGQFEKKTPSPDVDKKRDRSNGDLKKPGKRGPSSS